MTISVFDYSVSPTQCKLTYQTISHNTNFSNLLLSSFLLLLLNMHTRTQSQCYLEDGRIESVVKFACCSHSVQLGGVCLQSSRTQFTKVEECLLAGLRLCQRLQTNQRTAGWLLRPQAGVQQLSVHRSTGAWRGLDVEIGGASVGAGAQIQLWIYGTAIKECQQGAGGVLDQLLI